MREDQLGFIGFFTSRYPGESLYSLVARYQRYMFSTSKALKRHLFNAIHSFKFDYDSVYSLGFFYQKVSHFYSKEEILDMTLWKYFSAFMHKRRVRRLENSIFDVSISRTNSIVRDRYVKDASPRYCPLCFKKMIEEFGEAYWMITHQIPQIEICTTHNCLLKTIDLTTRICDKSIFHWASKELCNDLTATKNDNPRLLEIANCMTSLQNGDSKVVDINVREAYYKLGYFKGKNLYHKFLREDLIEYYKSLDLSSYLQQSSHRQDLFNYTFCSAPGDVQCARQIMLRLFLLDKLQNHSFKKYVGWPCFNKICVHYKKAVLDAVPRENGNAKFIIKCSCGWTYEAQNRLNGRIVKYRTIDRGTVWLNELHKAIKNGMKLNEVSKHLQVRPMIIVGMAKVAKARFLSKKIKKNLTGKVAIKREWLRRLQSKDFTSIMSEKIKDPGLYYAVFSNDRRWANTVNKKLRFRRSDISLTWLLK